MDVYFTVFKILTHKGKQLLIFPPLPCLTPTLRWEPVRISGWNLIRKKLKEWGYHMVKCHNSKFNCFWLIHPHDRQTDRPTDGRAIPHSACCRALIKIQLCALTLEHSIPSLRRWNNTFRKIFNCCWRESPFSLQFHTGCLPTHLIIHRVRKKTPPPQTKCCKNTQYITQSNDTYTR